MYLTKYPKIIKIGSQTKKLWPFEVGWFRDFFRILDFSYSKIWEIHQKLSILDIFLKFWEKFLYFIFFVKRRFKNRLNMGKLHKKCNVGKFWFFYFLIFSYFFRSFLVDGMRIWGTKTEKSTPRSLLSEKIMKKSKNKK